MADVARQCCLLIGACVDGQRALQTKVANAGGIDAILRTYTLDRKKSISRWKYIRFWGY